VSGTEQAAHTLNPRRVEAGCRPNPEDRSGRDALVAGIPRWLLCLVPQAQSTDERRYIIVGRIIDENEHSIRTAAGATIRRLLNLSTAHLPEHLGTQGGLDTIPGVVAHATDHGYLLWIPDDPDEFVATTADPVPDVVLAIQRYARELDCDYVLFDADAEQVDDLPRWDW
jgi:hypothetical protein